jgi:uncharacterized membrane protein
LAAGGNKDGWLAIVGGSYCLLTCWQMVWHGLLPPPMGNRNWVLALLAATPLLLPLRGILAGNLRSMTWGGYLSMLYLVVGVMEAWSNPPQRWPALAQTLWVGLFVVSTLVFSRRDPETG